MSKLRFIKLSNVMLLVVLAGSVMVSCGRHHKVEMYDEILLGATSAGTKALVTGKQSMIDLSYDNNTGFGVYGYKTITNRNYEYRQFNNILVYPTSKAESPTWTYAPKRYWDSNPDASYQFAAYWPHELTGGAFTSEANKVLTINDIPNWQEETAGSDIMVATKLGKYRGNSGEATTLSGGTVNFDFAHILSNIYFQGYYVGIQDNQVNILSMELSGTNMLTTDGNADYTLPFAGQSTPAQGFGTVTTGQSQHTLLPATTPVTLPTTSYYNDNENNPNQYDYSPICSWLVIPSTGWQNLTLTVTYSLGNLNQTPAPAAIPAAPVRISLGDGTINPQYKYLVTLKFNSASKGIEVESVKVADWNEITITPGVYNW